MIARKVQNAVEISFKYDPIMVSFVKSLEGRKYNPATKSWFIPFAGSYASLERLAKRGFTIDPSLWEEVRKDQEQAAEAEAMALLPDTEFETPLPLYGFQRVCSAFMVKTGSCLNACGVGTGKTVMAIATIQKLKTEKNLIICPKSLIYQWGERELQKWDRNAKVFIVYGNKRQRIRIYEEARRNSGGRFYLILGYETARTDIEELQKF